MNRYKLADKTAPRFRTSKFRYSLMNKDLYAKFKEAHPHTDIEWEEFKNINATNNKIIVQEVIDTRDGIELPKQMGSMYMGLFETNFFKSRRLPPDKYHNPLPFYSGELDGKIVFNFKRTPYKVKNWEFYTFSAHRNFKTAASQAFKNNPDMYVRTKDRVQLQKEIYKKIKLEYNERRHELDSASGDQPDQDA